MRKVNSILILVATLFSTLVGYSQRLYKNSPPPPTIKKYEKDTIHIDDDSTFYTIDNLGENVNEGHLSSGPRVSPDGKFLYFFKINHEKNFKNSRDIWVSEYNEKDSTWGVAYHAPQPLNDYGQNSVHWVSDDGKKLLLHGVYMKNLTMKNGVSISEKQQDGSWSFPKKIKIKGYKNKEVCSFELTPDEQVLISAIKQPKDTYGKQDLYVSFKIGDLTYSRPVNMGPVINTSGAEATAFLAPDNVTMYFSSEGHPNSLGGFDIYETKRLDSTWLKWSKPRHIGRPFNTADNDFYFTVPDLGDYVYLSRRFGTKEDQHSDIIRIGIKELEPKLTVSGLVIDDYSGQSINANLKYIRIEDNKVVANAEANPDKPYTATLVGSKKFAVIVESPDFVTYTDTIDMTDAKGGAQSREINYKLKRKPALVLNGKVLSSKDNTPIESEIVVMDKTSGMVVYQKKLGKDEPYEIKLPAGSVYDIKIRAKDHLTEDVVLNLTDLNEYQVQKKNFILKQIEKGLKFTVDNIYFEYNKADLTKESLPELDKLAEALLDAPNIKVEISAHTDWVGNDQYNMTLSQKRAKSVVDYMVSKGVEKRHLVSRGYGETRPIADNKTEEGRAKNRRVEFKILEVD